jgi:hypothetical protein
MRYNYPILLDRGDWLYVRPKHTDNIISKGSYFSVLWMLICFVQQDRIRPGLVEIFDAFLRTWMLDERLMRSLNVHTRTDSVRRVCFGIRIWNGFRPRDSGLE